MKRNTFAVAAIAFAVTAATIGTAVASFLPVQQSVAVFVRRIEANTPTGTTPLVSAGNHTLTLNASGVDVTVNVNDTTGPNDTRKGRTSADAIIKVSSSSTTVITPTPLPIVP
jgi:hypothetical protein